MKISKIKIALLITAVFSIHLPYLQAQTSQGGTGSAVESATPTSIIGHPITPEEFQQAIAAAGMAQNVSKQYQVQNLGSYPRQGKSRPVGASLLSEDAFKKAGYDPSENLRKALGGREDFEYRLHSNSQNSKSFYVQLRPAHAGEDKASIWLAIAPKPGVDPNAPLSLTPEEQAAATQKLDKIIELAGLDANSIQDTTLGRVLGVFRDYGIPLEDFNAALPKANAPGDRTAIGKDMVRLQNEGLLHAFTDAAIAAALPADTNQDGSKLDPSNPNFNNQLQANQIRNEVFSDNAYGAILAELLLNGKIVTNDGKRYKKPDEVANIVNQRLIEFTKLRSQLHVLGSDPLYYDEDKLLTALAENKNVGVNDLIRKNVLDKFAELVTPEPALSVPKFSWGNKVEFLSDGDAAFKQRVADLQALTDQAHSGKKPAYDFTVWKYYDNRPVDEHQLGQKLKTPLLDAGKAGVNIHITVDRSVAQRDQGEMAILNELGANKNTLVNLFNNDERGTPGDGNHSKSAVSNGHLAGASAIVGGRNIHGDYYYSWMDSEFRISGELAQYVQRAEDDMWLQQAKMHNRAALIQKPLAFQTPGKKGDVIGLATHDMPGPDSRFNGLIGILAGLVMADGRYTMVQAYVLPPIPGATLDPTLEAIKRAIQEGKNVDIITNSPQTVDTTQISSAIVQYGAHLLTEANKIRPQSLHVFMKKKWNGDGGATLHAKVAYDNSWFVSDTSNNLHPNGFVQHESQRYYIDEDLNALVRAWGEQLKDPQHSTEYTDPNILLNEQLPKATATNKVLDALLSLFPYQL